MTAQWWHLPSPDAWLGRALEDLDDGQCVVLRLPRIWDEADLFEVVRDRRHTMWFERVIVGDDDDLAEGLASIAGSEADLTIACRELAHQGTTAWLRVERALRPDELSELAEAQRHAGDVPLALVVEHVGPGTTAEQRAEVTLRIHHLYGVVSALDVRLLLSLAASDLTEPTREQISELVGFDLGLAMQLARAAGDGDEVLLALCDERARALGFDADSVAIPGAAGVPERSPKAFEAAWHLGAFDERDREVVQHPGLLLGGDRRRRLWKGQVRSILPLLDELRVELLTRGERHGLTLRPERGDIVEFPAIVRAFESNLSRNHPLTLAAREMRKARNDLAHLKTIDHDRRRILRERIVEARLMRTVPI